MTLPLNVYIECGVWQVVQIKYAFAGSLSGMTTRILPPEMKLVGRLPVIWNAP